MAMRGADFSDIQPRNNQGNLDISFVDVPSTAQGLDTGRVFQLTANNAFRMGQQLILWLGVSNPVFGEGGAANFISRVQIKPWWARPNTEFRQAFGGDGGVGSAGAEPIDRVVFGEGPLGNLLDNRNVWIPSPKRLDITEFQTPPPPASPARHSDSLLVQDLWTMDLQDPTDPNYSGKFGADQVVARWVPIFYPAFGYALGITYDVTEDNPDGDAVTLRVSLSWTQGTFGGPGRIEESIG